MNKPLKGIIEISNFSDICFDEEACWSWEIKIINRRIDLNIYSRISYREGYMSRKGAIKSARNVAKLFNVEIIKIVDED